jgi:hypothetical protein
MLTPGPSVEPGEAFRQAKQLAECQRARKSSFFSSRHPPPPANDNWRSGSNFPRKTHVFAMQERHLAEGP